jgi:hypothetical protein
MLRIAAAPSPLNVAAAAAAGLALAAAGSAFQVQAATRSASLAAQLGDVSAASTPPSAASLAMTLATVPLAPIGGAVAIDLSRGNTFVVAMTANATISFLNWPAGRSQRVAVYFVQDETGSRLATWPAVKWPDGQAPALSQNAGAIDCVVFDSFDGGASVFANLVGEGYA